MRRVSILATLALVGTMALTGCGGKEDDNSASDGPTSATTSDTTSASETPTETTTESSAPSADEDVCKTASGDGPKVGLAYDVGGRGDQSFNDAAYVGLAKAVSDIGATCVEGEAATDEPESAREDRLRGMADDGATAIIGVGFAYSDAVEAVAPDYPDVSFAIVDGYDSDPDSPNDNVAYLTFAANQGSYLVGVAAGLATKTNEVGFVGGVHNDLIKGFEAGYVAGVKAVNPKAKVDVQYIQESDLSGFGDPAGGKTAATGEYDKGADVVYHAAGASGSGVFEAAVAAGKLAIGVDSDQYLTATPDAQPLILTSALKRVDTAAFDFISSVADGSPKTSYVTYDLSNDGVGYSKSNTALITPLEAKIDEYAAKIKSGEIEVPTKP